MANPLSDKGYSDRDFAAAVGIAMGETGANRISKDEMAAVIDVAKNRLDTPETRHRAKETSLYGVITAPGQFDASNPRGSKGGREKYDAAWNTIINGAPMRPDMQARYNEAVKQVVGVLGTGTRAGIARNATEFSSTAKKLSAKETRIHNALGKRTGTKIGATTFYGPRHNTKEKPYSGFGRYGTPKEARAPQQTAISPTSYSRHDLGPYGTPKEAIPAATPDISMGRFYDEAAAPAPYSPASLDFGPDFSSPPSQARGAVTDPYGFSNVNTAVEAAPGNFAGYGPNAFAGLDEAPVDYGQTYPDITAGLYSNVAGIAPPDVPAVPDVMSQFDAPSRMTEQEAIERAGLAGQVPSANVETRYSDYGETVDEQVARNAAAVEQNDYLAALYGNITGQPVNPASFTTNPYEVPTGPLPPERVDAGRWGGTTPFNDKFADLSLPSFQEYENRSPLSLADLGIGAIASPGPVGMAKAGGVELQRDISGISAGMYPYEAVFEAVRNAPTSTTPMSNEDFNAIFGNLPDDATGSVRGARAAPDAFPVNAPRAGGPYSFSNMQSWAPAPDAATIPNDVTGYGPGGAFSSRAPAPGFDFGSIVNDTFGPYADGGDIPAASAQVSGAPMTAGPGPAETGMTFPDISAGLYGGPAVTASTSPFSPSALGPATGFGNYGNYDAVNNPVGYSAKEFSQAPNVPAPSPQIIGYEPGKTITRDVPNPAWSDWSREYGTRNALQDAWLAADEDKFGVDPIRSSFVSRPAEPARTIQREKTLPATPIYGPSVPAVNAQPVSAPMQPSTWSPGMTAQANAFGSLLGSIGGYGLQGVPGTFAGGFDLAALGGGYGGYGNFGGGYDPGGYGGGYGGTAPGDAGYGSDARSGSGNMGAGNLYA